MYHAPLSPQCPQETSLPLPVAPNLPRRQGPPSVVPSRGPRGPVTRLRAHHTRRGSLGVTSPASLCRLPESSCCPLSSGSRVRPRERQPHPHLRPHLSTPDGTEKPSHSTLRQHPLTMRPASPSCNPHPYQPAKPSRLCPCRPPDLTPRSPPQLRAPLATNSLLGSEPFENRVKAEKKAHPRVQIRLTGFQRVPGNSLTTGSKDQTRSIPLPQILETAKLVSHLLIAKGVLHTEPCCPS